MMAIDPKEKIKLIDKALPRLRRSFERCELCLRNCHVNRSAGEIGFCKAPENARVYSYAPHLGEEPPLSGAKGSGTIFFSHCNMRCVYCQNNQFSQAEVGAGLDREDLASLMLELAAKGCHNINLVSPTHFVTPIVEGLREAYEKGLSIPVVYNTGGYDNPDVIRALDGIVDIYLPDMRYASDEMALKYSEASGYVQNNREIVREMWRQAGGLKVKGGVAEKGLIIRLLILPLGISGTVETLEYIARHISTDVFLSVMSQYYPAYKAREYVELSRRIVRPEYAAVTEKLSRAGFKNGWVQPFEGDFDESFAGENFEPNI